MNSGPSIRRLQEGQVDASKERFELRYGSAEDGGWSDWTPVALVGPPEAGVVRVQFLGDSSDPRNRAPISKAREEIRFYLFDKGEENPWAYAQFHCGTSSNVYSKIHWSFFKAGMKTRHGADGCSNNAYS